MDDKGFGALAEKLIETAGPVGAFVAILAVVLTTIARWRGWSMQTPPSQSPPAQTPSVETTIVDRLNRITGDLQSIDARLKNAEQDIAARPTREDMHRVETTVVRLEERMAASHQVSLSIGIAVQRIEQFLIDISKR